ncbi:MAG: hypothetical protein JW923_06200 [Spirochaetales bacterium]|nr:hypothetical protein [Spirochaetales bacterium]MBP7262903.1 hypothetical protein [Spirochaetia bacterium]
MTPNLSYRLRRLVNDPVFLGFIIGGLVVLNLSFFGSGVPEAMNLRMSDYRKAVTFWSAIEKVARIVLPLFSMYLGVRLVGPELPGGHFYVELAHVERKGTVFWNHLRVALTALLGFLALVFVNVWLFNVIFKVPGSARNMIEFMVGYTSQSLAYLSVGLIASTLMYGWSGLALCLAAFVAGDVVNMGEVPFLYVRARLPSIVRGPLMFVLPTNGAIIKIDNPELAQRIPAFIFRMGVPYFLYQIVWSTGVAALALRIMKRKDY